MIMYHGDAYRFVRDVLFIFRKMNGTRKGGCQLRHVLALRSRFPYNFVRSEILNGIFSGAFHLKAGHRGGLNCIDRPGTCQREKTSQFTGSQLLQFVIH